MSDASTNDSQSFAALSSVPLVAVEEISVANQAPAGGSSQRRPFAQHLCLSRIAQRKPATDWQNELAIAHIIGKFAYLRWIRLREHARDLYCGMRRRAIPSAIRRHTQRSLPASPLQSTWPRLHRQRYRQLRPRPPEHRNRFVVINRQHARDTEGASVLQLFLANAGNHLRTHLLCRMHRGSPHAAHRSRYQYRLSLSAASSQGAPTGLPSRQSAESPPHPPGLPRSGRWVTSESGTATSSA